MNSDDMAKGVANVNDDYFSTVPATTTKNKGGKKYIPCL